MVKKLVVLTLVGLGAAAVLTKTKFGSYVRSAFHSAEESINDSIPNDWELSRIRGEVARLDKDIDKAKGELAKARVEAKLLAEDIEKMRIDVEANEAVLLKRGEELKAAASTDKVKWNGRSLYRDDAKQELQTAVNRHKNRRDELAVKEKTLGIRERNRDVLEKQVSAMIQQKSELATAVDRLEAEINLAKLEQVESRHQNDGSRMAEIKTSLAELQKRIAVKREKLTIARDYDPANDASAKTVDEILADLKGDANTVKAE
jgi:chromosome segregation ATPase